jgi:signal transduction histidine kinase
VTTPGRRGETRAPRADRRSDGSLARPVAQFALTSLAALVVLTVVGVLLLREQTTAAATRQARDIALLAGEGIVEPELTAGVLEGDPEALERLGLTIEERVLGDRIVRVKLWTSDGTIIYSDEPRLVGAVYPLPEDKRGVLASGEPEAEVSDLSREENRFERDQGELLEVYVPLRTPDGQQVLFETYQRFDTVSASARRILLAAAPVAIGALALLWLIQLPLAVRLARRVRDGLRERERLLERAVGASDAERRRIAADLHDGVVQDMAGLAYGLDAAAATAPGDARSPLADALRDGAERARRAMRSLRSLLVDIHPPSLRSEGLRAALSDLLAPLEERGIASRLHVDDPTGLGPEDEELIFRAAREGVRNALAHARPSEVAISVMRQDAGVMLTVEDDGRGFDVAERERRRSEGHMGLTLLEELSDVRGGALRVESAPGGGTRLSLELPAG